MKKYVFFLFVFMLCISSVSFADDNRTIIDHVEITSNMANPPEYAEALPNSYSYTTTVGSPAFMTSQMWIWQKKNGENWDDYNGSVFREGTYRCINQLRITSGSDEYRLDSTTRVFVDGYEWTIDMSSVTIEEEYCSISYLSPEYEVERTEMELTFEDRSAFDRNNLWANEAITPIDFRDAVIGGAGHYYFYKYVGPDWITVSSDGIATGTPIVEGVNPDLVVIVRDYEGEERQVLVHIGVTHKDPSQRTVISEVEISSNMPNPPKSGDAVETIYEYETTVGTQAILSPHMGHWEKYVDGVWNAYQESTFVDGKYRFINQFRVDTPEAYDYIINSTTTLKVDGVYWTVPEDVYINKRFCYAWVTSPEYIIAEAGDIDGNGSIEILDVRLLLQAYINSSPSTVWTPEQLAKMDMNNDETITILDVRLLLQKYINS